MYDGVFYYGLQCEFRDSEGGCLAAAAYFPCDLSVIAGLLDLEIGFYHTEFLFDGNDVFSFAQRDTVKLGQGLDQTAGSLFFVHEHAYAYSIQGVI